MANHTKGRPHLFGNKFSKGRPKPAGSGMKPTIAFGPVTNFTFRIGREDLAKLEIAAKDTLTTKASIMREALLDWLEHWEFDRA